MEITLKQVEIQQAIKDYIGNTGLGIDLTGRDVQIDLKAGRGANGHYAVVEILPQATQENADSATSGKESDNSDDDQAIDFDFEEEDED